MSPTLEIGNFLGKEARGPLDIEEYVSPCLKDQTIVL